MNVQSLLEKYLEIVRLRELHAAPAEPDPRPALRALAARFPGALRELDKRPLNELANRIALLRSVLEGAPRAPWMDAQLAFHSLLRGALIAKRWLDRRRIVDEDVRSAFRSTIDDEDALSWTADLALLAAPPHGRILDVVLIRVASDMRRSDNETRALLA